MRFRFRSWHLDTVCEVQMSNVHILRKLWQNKLFDIFLHYEITRNTSKITKQLYGSQGKAKIQWNRSNMVDTFYPHGSKQVNILNQIFDLNCSKFAWVFYTSSTLFLLKDSGYKPDLLRLHRWKPGHSWLRQIWTTPETRLYIQTETHFLLPVSSACQHGRRSR